MTTHWWGYDKHEKVYKTNEFLIRMLVDIVSKGGNLLLNIGPKPDGTIQKEFVDRLVAIGKWMDEYSEAIYGTTASPFNLLPFYGRVTTKGDKLYVHVFEWPGDRTARLPNLANTVRAAYMLGPDDLPIPFGREGADWAFELPKKAPDRAASVFVVELDGPPQVTPVVIGPGSEGAIGLPALYGSLEAPHGQRIRYESRDGIVHAGNWTRPPDGIEWQFQAPKAGVYPVLLDHAVEADQGGSEVQVILNGKVAACMAPNGVPFSSGDADLVGGATHVFKTAVTGGEFKRKNVGNVKLRKGVNELKLVVSAVKREKSLDLRGVSLKPV